MFRIRENAGVGTLYIVPTPIGNREDITLRALNILRSVDLVLCEDTRVSRKLFEHYELSPHCMSYHAQSSATREREILELLREGKKFALISDAGTPAISDPGAKLLARIYEQGIPVRIVPLPGPSAVTTAVSASGFFGNQFCFYGFLPQKKGRRALTSEMLQSGRISVFYESPHRLMKWFSLVRELSPEAYENRQVFVAREITKIYEDLRRGTIREVHESFIEDGEGMRGEFTVVLDACR